MHKGLVAAMSSPAAICLRQNFPAEPSKGNHSSRLRNPSGEENQWLESDIRCLTRRTPDGQITSNASDCSTSRRVSFSLVFFSMGGSGRSQTVQDVQRKFGDLREDNIPGNASNATAWLFVRRDKLRDAMLEELYRTDRQGRDAILQILFQTPSFVPDERFLRFVVARLGEEDIYVSNRIIDTVMHYERLPNGEPGRLNGFNGAHHDAWIFIDAHFEAFEPLLREQIGKTKSMWTLWGTA